jgi:hypothetical protein
MSVRTAAPVVSRRTPAVGWLASRWFRRRWLATTPVAVIVLVGATGAMAALATANRTSTAYRDYLQRANVGDLVLNPSVNTRQIDEVIRTLPAVEQVTSSAMFAATFDEGAPRTRFEVEATGSQTYVTGSADGRYTDMDRPALQSGRMPTGPNEAAPTVEAAEAEGMRIGDVVSIAFWQAGASDGLAGEVLERWTDEVVSPVGVEHVTVVGVVTLPDEALPDELYPRQRLLVSPDVATRYECLPDEPPPGVTLAQAVQLLTPAGCAVQYHYYSLALANGADDVTPTLDAFLTISTEMNEALLDISDLGQVPGEAPQYFAVPTETAQELDRVERANRPTVAALVVLGLAAAVATVALTALTAARELRRTRGEQRQWHQLGVGSTARAIVAGLPLAIAAVLGAVLAMVASWLLDTGPIGVVQVVEPHAARRVNSIALLALGALAMVSLLTIAVLAITSARGASSLVAGRASSPRPFRVRVGSPADAEGVRAAYGQRTAIPVLVGLALLSGAFVASISFGSSLSSLLSTPGEYGWPWDVAAMTGAGYGDLDIEAVEQHLADDPDVEGFSVLGFLHESPVEGDAKMTLLQFEQGGAGASVSLLAGTLPDEPGEIGMGSTTADDLGLEVGDSVEIGGGVIATRLVRVTGIVVFPVLGPMQADRVATGTGVYVPHEFFDAPDLAGLAGELDGLKTFVGVDVRDDARDLATIARLENMLMAFDQLGAPAMTFSDPIRPPEIVDAGSARSVPSTVGIVFAGLAAVGMLFASWASVRSRRRELAVLQTLGFTRSQVRRTVWVQSLATTVGALVIGVPLGAIAGRALWREFAEQLGVVSDPATPVVPLVATIVVALCLAVLAAQVPARFATRSRLADDLRAE